MDFVRRHGIEEDYIASHEQFRGIVLFHRTQAAIAAGARAASARRGHRCRARWDRALDHPSAHLVGGARPGRLSQSRAGRAAPHLRAGYPQEVRGGKDLARAARRGRRPGRLRAGGQAPRPDPGPEAKRGARAAAVAPAPWRLPSCQARFNEPAAASRRDWRGRQAPRRRPGGGRSNRRPGGSGRRN